VSRVAMCEVRSRKNGQEQNKTKKKYSGQQQKEIDCGEPHPAPNEKTQPIQWTERPTGALMAVNLLWPSPKESRFSLSRLSTARHSSPKPPENRSNRRRRQHSPSTRVFLSLSPLVFSRLVPSATDPPGVSLRSLSLSLSSVYCAAPFSNPRAL